MMEIDGHTGIMGLIGNPVEHTYSPLIQNTFARVMGVNMVYVPLGVREGLSEALKGAFAFGFAGMNVTVPYKLAVMPYLCGIDPAAERIGAVNTLVREEEGYRGYNTDVVGISATLERFGIDVCGRDCILIGAGGAARAVYDALSVAGADHIYLLNRSLSRARENFGSFPDVTILSLENYASIPAGKYFCVQCTSVGLPPDTGRTAIEDEDFYELVETGFDLIYNPEETEFMRRVRAHGGQAVNGMEMLLAQAAVSFALFTGTEVSEEAMEEARRALSEELCPS